MRHSRRYREIESEETQIDISPLIDIVFILVIFFIVTTVFNKPVGLDVDPPPRTVSTKSLDASSVTVALSESGQVFYGGRNIGFDGLEAVIISVRDGGEPVPVIAICDRNATAEDITKLQDAARRAEAKSFSMATQ